MNGNTDEWILKLNAALQKVTDNIIDCKDAFDQLQYRINNLEVKIDNLRAQFETHDHPFKHEPRYG